MGIFEFILKGLGPEARKELAKKAAKGAVKNVGDAVFDRADGIRQDFEDAAEARRASKEKERAEEEKERAVEQRREDAIEAEAAIDDELAALKARIDEPD